jgi:predicted nucleotidyltransferase
MLQKKERSALPLDPSAVVGIICEYNPFHRGHARQFELIREKLPGAAIVCVMSGPFTQRGMPAVYSPAQRAKSALEAGADLVLELPALFALREAEHFALGGVSILNDLGFVTHISFGCETEDLELLGRAAEVLETQEQGFRGELKEALRKGVLLILSPPPFPPPIIF